MWESLTKWTVEAPVSDFWVVVGILFFIGAVGGWILGGVYSDRVERRKER